MSLIEHLEKLRHFVKVTNYRSINETAQAMGVSQAGLSKSIAALEDVLETQLFVRSREGLILTKEGEEVLKASNKILTEAAELETRLRSLKATNAPSVLKIGMYDSIAVYFYSELKSYLGTLYPDVELRMTVDTSGSLGALVQKGDLDIAVGVNLDRGAKSSVEFFKLFDDHYSFYVSSKTEVNIETLPLLIHPLADDQHRKTVEDYLSPLINKRGAHRVLNFETLKTLTQQGVGIGILPTQVAKPLVKKGALVSVEVPKTKHLFGLHRIGFLATKNFLQAHRDFAEDIYRLGDRWSKT